MFEAEYVEKIIQSYRNEFIRLDKELQEQIKANAFSKTLLPQCQLEIIDFEQYGSVWIINHDSKRMDKLVSIKLGKNEQKKKNLEHILEQYDFFNNAWTALSQTMRDAILTDGVLLIFEDDFWWAFYKQRKPYEFALWLLDNTLYEIGDIINNEQHLALKESAERLKKDVTLVAENDVRARLEITSNKIDAAVRKLQTIDEHEEKLCALKSDLDGVHRLIGRETYGEWKVLINEIDKNKDRINSLSNIKEAYDKVLAQQSEVMKQQSSFINWIKYATILVPIAAVSVPILEILLRQFLGIP
ncbi:MAG: hypothetical protein CW691_00355 [Candidatus Bathyarchaeum sp.]|nr:MAG: hypothetical protein CW691_00355 [Candidatus Bathyarchaeum sp.]